eukprot:1162066-Pelagomonas_calceolata.AAC.2
MSCNLKSDHQEPYIFGRIWLQDVEKVHQMQAHRELDMVLWSHQQPRASIDSKLKGDALRFSQGKYLDCFQLTTLHDVHDDDDDDGGGDDGGGGDVDHSDNAAMNYLTSNAAWT